MSTVKLLGAGDSYNPGDACAYCRSPLGGLGNRIITHTGGGERHPLHEKCVREWLLRHGKCPVCLQEVDAVNYFYLGKKRVFKIIERNFRDFFDDKYIIVAGIILGALEGLNVVIDRELSHYVSLARQLLISNEIDKQLIMLTVETLVSCYGVLKVLFPAQHRRPVIQVYVGTSVGMAGMIGILKGMKIGIFSMLMITRNFSCILVAGGCMYRASRELVSVARRAIAGICNFFASSLAAMGL